MQENTNKAIAINSLINYAKMGINTILALLTTRFALLALGVADFGLYSVLGSIISFIGIFNTIMLSTCNRFLAVAIGKGDPEEIRKQFNVNLTIFIGIAFFMFLVSYPVGSWYVHNFIKYEGPVHNAMMVFCLSIAGSIFSTLATPYNGLLMAKERFLVFSVVDVIVHIVRFIVAVAIVSFFKDKLLIYTITMAFTTAIPALIYWIYCRRNYRSLVEWSFVRDKSLYREVLSFSGWIGYGAFAFVSKNQGAALLVNAFFNTVMNTALGLANSLNAYITMFANNLTQPMQPQITKSYAIGNTARTDELLVMSTRFSFLLMLFVSAPFMVDSKYVLSIWLGDVPLYAAEFTLLLIIDNLIQSFNAGISTVLFASGKIARYQVIINTLRLLSIVVAFFVLRLGVVPFALFYTYIVFSLLCVLASQWCLKKELDYSLDGLWKNSYLPSILSVITFLPVLLLPSFIHPVIRISMSMVYLLVDEFFVGLSKKERLFVINKIQDIIHK